MHSLRIIPAQQLNPVKWNHCVQADPCGLIYSRFEYLQHICDHWAGMVLDDYAGVMALPFRIKWGIRYVYHPAFLQQTGLIGSIPAEGLSRVIPAIYRQFSYGDIPFHFGNLPDGHIPVKERTNLILKLDAAYSDLASHYRQDLKQSLRIAAAADTTYRAIPVEDGADFYRYCFRHRPFISEKEHIRFRQLCQFLFTQDACFARGIFKGNTLLASALLLKDDKRIYLIANAVLPEERKTRANHGLIDALIREKAGSGLLLDFEGSDIPGVKNFYLSFAAEEQPYYYWHFNRLPWPLRLWKR
ncbi:MAG TPA: hypothetical protein VG842_03270 [Sediminibacterium sp.]|nr:hypothetical protein [Sediminibacterium sp.]